MKKDRPFFAEQLRKIMFEKDITQQELANKIDVAQTVISRWLNADRNPSLSSVKKLANYFNVPWSYFIENFEENTSLNTENSDDKDSKILQLEEENLKLNREVIKLEKEILKEITDIKKQIIKNN